MKVQTLKGFRDFLPKEAKKRQYVIDKIRGVFESYGFEALETPALEYKEILTGKYGEEEKLIYDFKTRGGDEVALRYDQTVPLARVVAQYGSSSSGQALPMPFKRYQIQNVWRGENTQKGRYREFLQCDADIVGTTSLAADAEIIAVCADALRNLGFFRYKILINDRAEFEGLDRRIIGGIDKLQKAGRETVILDLTKKGFKKEELVAILDSIESKKPTEKISKILSSLANLGVEPLNIEFSPTLARGLDYYTGLIFEAEIEDYKAGSIGGGGRYDKLIGMFAGKDIPAVGFSFGFDRLIEAMDELGLFPADLETTKVLVTENNERGIEIADKLRSAGINTEIWLDEGLGLGKKVKYAEKKSIPYIIKFDSEGKMILGNMKTGEQKTGTLEDIAAELK